MSKPKKERGRTSLYAKMLNNITSDLDGLFSDLQGSKGKKDRVDHHHHHHHPDNPAEASLSPHSSYFGSSNDTKHSSNNSSNGGFTQGSLNPAIAGMGEVVGGGRQRLQQGHVDRGGGGGGYEGADPQGVSATTRTIRTQCSGDTLGKDSLLSSSVGNTSRRQGDGLSSNQSLTSDIGGGGGGDGGGCTGHLFNLAACSDGRHHDGVGDGESSMDSGHGGTGRSRSRSGGRTLEGSPLVFDPLHFSQASPVAGGGSAAVSAGPKVVVDISPGMDEFRAISTVERLVKTNSIWLLASLSRAGAVHILKDRDTGNFIVRKSSQPQSLALSVQSRLCGHPAVDHYLIHGSDIGFRLEGSAHAFHSIPALISYYIENIDEIPYHLRLPVAIQQAKSTRELASLDMLGQDFWSSPLSRKSPMSESTMFGNHSLSPSLSLHKSQSEPINIQRQQSSSSSSTARHNNPFLCQNATLPHHPTDNTPPFHSTEKLNHFMQAQAEMDRYFSKRLEGDYESCSSPEASSPRCLDNHSHSHTAGTSASSDVRLATPDGAAKVVAMSGSLSEQEPIYSVSKKQKIKKHVAKSAKPKDRREEVGTSRDAHHNAVPHRETPPSLPPKDINLGDWEILGDDKGHLQGHEDSPPPLPPIHHLSLLDGEENPYRRSVSSQPAGGVTPVSGGMSASWDPNLSREEDFLEGVKTKQRSHSRPSDTSDQGISMRPKANLYFTTNLGLLEMPESTYFTSTLSDKLSDYEDIWRNSSCAESDYEISQRHKYSSKDTKGKSPPIPKQRSQLAARMIADPRAVMDARLSQSVQIQLQQQKQHSESRYVDKKSKSESHDPAITGNVSTLPPFSADDTNAGTGAGAQAAKIAGKRKMLRKTYRDIPASRRVNPAARDSVTGGSTGLTALEQARRLAGSTSDEDNATASPTSPLSPHQIPPPVAHVKGIRRLAATGVFDYPEDDDDGALGREGNETLRSPPVIMAATTSAVNTTTSRTMAVSKTAVVTNTNSIRILPSRPNQIKFVTSHSLDFSPRDLDSNSITSSQNQHRQTRTSPVASGSATVVPALTPTPTSTKSLPAHLASKNAQTCVLTTTMAVIMSEPNSPQTPTPPQPTTSVDTVATSTTTTKSSTNTRNGKSSTHKPINGSGHGKSGTKLKDKIPLLSQLSRLSRLKSSSESSLATVSSPMYAEPVDTVRLRDKLGRPINVQVRRQSAPTGPQKLMEKHHHQQKANQSNQNDHQQHKVSQDPCLETIFSPGLDGAGAEGSKNEFQTKFSFDGLSAGGQGAHVETSNFSNKASGQTGISRSQSMRTTQEDHHSARGRELQRKHSWRDRLHRLKLGTRVLARNLAPPTAPSSKHPMHISAPQTPEDIATCNLLQDMEDASMSPHPSHLVPRAEHSPAPSTPTPGKFPVMASHLLNIRDSCFSESSTVQDLISCAHPEFNVRPIQPGRGVQLDHILESRVAPVAPSEYDNLGIYTAPSVGTVYSPPWDSSLTSRIMRGESLRPSPLTISQQSQQMQDQLHSSSSSQLQQLPPPLPLPTIPSPVTLSNQFNANTTSSVIAPLSISHVEQRLPPAMDFQERIARWQEHNTSYLSKKELQIKKAGTSGAAESGHTGSDRVDASSPVILEGNLWPAFGDENTHHQNQFQQISQHEIHQQRQLLHHQHQLRNNEPGAVNGNRRSFSVDSNDLQLQRPKERSGQVASIDAPGMMKSINGPESSLPIPLPSPVSPAIPPAIPPPMSGNAAQASTNHTSFASSPTPYSPNPALTPPVTTSPTSNQRLSSHCPDVVHCHSTPVPPTTPSSPSFLNPPPSHLRLGAVEAVVLGNPQMVGEDDVLFGGSIEISPELQQKISPVLSPGYTISQMDKAPGTKIREYIFKLSCDRNTTFGSTIENFIQCTLESQETNPQHVLRNVRQFMSGIKNYLVKHGEGMLEDMIERERIKLGPDEILNIDAIIEQALHVCVLKPLKYHIYRLFVEKYSETKALEQLSRNIKYARTRSAEDLGVKPGLRVPDSSDMEVIKYYLDLMQRSYSPLQKLQNLLKATSTIYRCVQGREHPVPNRGPSSLGADDFLPMLIYVLVHCGLVAAEIEADFMWGLLQPSLLTGEGGYYLTTLSSAVLVLKNFQETHDLAPSQHQGQLPTLSDMQGFLKIAIPDELHDSINWKTLPVRPNMNTRDVCALVAHKFKVTNPHDYGLFLLCDGQESQMADSDCPQIIKADYLATKRKCFFAFKRLDANIAWPKQLKESPAMATDTI